MEIYFYKLLLKIKQSLTPVPHIFVFNTLQSSVYLKRKQSKPPVFSDGYMCTMPKSHFSHYNFRRQTVLFDQEGIIFQYSYPISRKSERISFLKTDSGGDFWFIYISWMWSPGLHFIWSGSQAIKTNEHLLPKAGS